METIDHIISNQNITEIILLIINSILIVTILLIVILKKNKTGDNHLAELKRNIKDDLNDTRKELRELNVENRREINDLFKGFQDTLLKRISENIYIQKAQLDSFSKSLNELSEKLIDNFNQLRENLSESARKSNEAINKKQDDEIIRTQIC